MPPTADFDWEREGATVGATLDGVHAIVVLGDDADATARVAMGIARVQARHRRVAVGDLLGEAPPIQALVRDEVAHGITDSFVYGVSMTKIAYPVDEAGELFVMPTGTEPIDYAEILPNARWRRLASGFREVGALLVLAAPASAPRIEELVDGMDGAVLVGEMVPRSLPVAQVLAGVRQPRPSKLEPSTPTSDEAPPLAAAAQPAATSARWLRYLAIPLLVAMVAIVGWLFYRPMADGPQRPTAPPTDTTRNAPQVGLAPVEGTSTGASGTASDSLAAVDTTRPPDALASAVVNPADSARAARWAVSFRSYNTQAGALLTLHNSRNAVPAATYAPVQQQGARWFLVVGGAFATRREAESLLASLRTARDPDADPVSVVSVPYAFLVHERVAPAQASRLVGQLVERGHPAYALRQANGSANVYVGAFESPSQAALVAGSLQSSGLAPTLAFRLGRVF